MTNEIMDMIGDLQGKDKLNPPVWTESFITSPGLYHLLKSMFVHVETFTCSPVSLRITTILVP